MLPMKYQKKSGIMSFVCTSFHVADVKGSPHQHDEGEDIELHTSSAMDFEDYSTEMMFLWMYNTPKQMVLRQ